MNTSEIIRLKRICEQTPRNFKAWRNYGEALLGAKKFGEAVEAFKKAIELKPDDPISLNLLGLAYKGLSLYIDAIEAFKGAIKLAPQYAVAMENIAVCLLALKKPVEAIQFLQAALKLVPASESAHLSLALAYRAAGNLELALSEYNEAFKLNPKNWRTRFSMIAVYEELGNIEEAYGIARELFSLLKNTTHCEEIKETYRRLLTLFRNKYRDKQIVGLEEEEMLSCSEPAEPAHEKRTANKEIDTAGTGEAFQTSDTAGPGSPENLLITLQQRILANPFDDRAHQELAELFVSRGQYEQAIIEFRRVIGILRGKA